MNVCGCEFETEKKESSQLILSVIAGQIWNDEEAKVKCPVVCASYGGEWTGQWQTPKETWGKTSICECKFTF